MTYIELINNFWAVRRVRPMTSYEADMYFYLLKECNSRNWTNPFELPTRNIEFELGISRKTICDLRNKLQQKGLISFKEGAKRAGSAIYKIVYVTEGNINGNIHGNINGNINGNTNIKTKTKTESMGLFPPPSEDKPKRQPKARKPEFIPPTPDEVREYFRDRLPDWEEQAATFYDHYDSLNWHTATGAKVQRWEGRANLWISEEKLKPHEQRQDNPADRRRADKEAKIRQLADEYAAIGAGTDVGGDPPEIPDL